MTGFKDGASDSPFDEDADEDTSPTSTDVQTPDRELDDATGDTELPWVYARENARDGRPRTKQLHYQPSTERREGQFETDVETALGERINKTDLREAAVLVAMDHVDEVADKLREWGYDQ
jgi:hypothetical protein